MSQKITWKATCRLAKKLENKISCKNDLTHNGLKLYFTVQAIQIIYNFIYRKIF